MRCDCNPDKINAVHGYLDEHFPGATLHDFHPSLRLAQAGLPPPQAQHHVVRVEEDSVSRYVILIYEFMHYSPAEITDRLGQWGLADFLRGIRFVVVSKDGLAAL